MLFFFYNSDASALNPLLDRTYDRRFTQTKEELYVVPLHIFVNIQSLNPLSQNTYSDKTTANFV